MIFYFNGDGSFIDCISSEVYQGSHNVNTVYFVGPFSSNCQVTAKFKLENGEETTPQLFTFKKDFSEALVNANNQGVCVWEGVLTHAITKVGGRVRVQFTVVSLTNELATESVTFKVKKGVIGTNIQVTDADVFNQILQIVSGIEDTYADATNKLSKVSVETNKDQAYIKESNGEQNMIDISEAGSGDIVKRKQDGNITAGTPTIGTDATPKNYVDNNFYTKTDVNDLLEAISSQSATGVATENYNLIEKIIVGYTITTSEPLDWATNYTSYFINTGTKKKPIYTNVSGDTAPTWEEGKYFAYNVSSSGLIFRSYDIFGNPYSLKNVLCYFKIQKGTASANLYTYFYYGSNKKLLITLINTGNIQTTKPVVYQIVGLSDKGEFVEVYSTSVSQNQNAVSSLGFLTSNKEDNSLNKEDRLTQIAFVPTGSLGIPAGTEIYIYGE